MNYQIFITYNEDENGDRVSTQILNENYVVYSSRIVLNQIPDDYYGVQISDSNGSLVENKNQNNVLGLNEFKVDYSNVMINFHEDKEGVSLTVDN
jgi:hypothetical protein